MNKFKNYAINAASYILQNLPDNLADKIDNVIFFGSTARDTATNESDIDLFFDIKIGKKSLGKAKALIFKLIEDFYVSNAGLTFKLEGTGNKINAIIGNLDEWIDLKRSIISDGIIVFGKYKSNIEKDQLKQHLIFYWENPPKNRGAFLNKLYGYNVGKKRYAGLIQKYNGEKIGKSALIIPSEYKNKLMEIMKKYSVSYNIIEIYL